MVINSLSAWNNKPSHAASVYCSLAVARGGVTSSIKTELGTWPSSCSFCWQPAVEDIFPSCVRAFCDRSSTFFLLCCDDEFSESSSAFFFFAFMPHDIASAALLDLSLAKLYIFFVAAAAVSRSLRVYV